MAGVRTHGLRSSVRGHCPRTEILACKQLRWVLERFEFQRVAGRVVQKECGLFAHESWKTDMRFDFKALAGLTQALHERMPLRPFEDHAEMRHRYLMPVDGVRGLHVRPGAGIQMRNELMTEQIEIDPMGIATTLGTAEDRAVKSSRRTQVMDRNREMKGADHGRSLPGWAAIGAARYPARQGRLVTASMEVT